MPLHQIPLCGFSYVGVNPSSSATFEYDTRVQINKITQKLFYKNSVIEIDKNNTKMAYGNCTIIDKNNSSKGLYKNNIEIIKSIESGLNKAPKYIDRHIEKDLNSMQKSMIKENLLALNGETINIGIFESKDLSPIGDPELLKNITKQIAVDKITVLDNSNIIINLENCSKTKCLDKNYNFELDLIRMQELSKVETINLKRNNEKDLNITVNNKYMDTIVARNMDIKNNNIYANRIDEKKVDISKIIYLDRENIKEISKTTNSKLAYKTNNLKLDKYNYISVDKDNAKNIFKDKQHLLYRNGTKCMIKRNKDKLILNDASKKIFKDIEKYLEKIDIKNICKGEALSLEKDVIRDIFKGQILGLTKFETEISNIIDMKGLNKSNIIIYKSCELKGLNKFARNIYIPHATKFIEVTKRWWVLEATAPEDLKILPVDYRYSENPLSINRRDREYGNRAAQNNHPISFMPYMENNVGIDLNYGLDEINLSIEIMLDMVNIVGMIVMRCASQFANASGQESIEFIMELLLDWFNMDSTIQEMDLKGSRKHYLRTYRWIRWEAEKVWFKADKDHSMDKMKGIKYAGMLFANLIDYMKYHHFNLVPIWRNLKCMDLERNFNRVATNGDLMKDLDKLKGRRHYFIETKNKI